MVTVPSLEESVCIGDEGQVGSENILISEAPIMQLELMTATRPMPTGGVGVLRLFLF